MLISYLSLGAMRLGASQRFLDLAYEYFTVPGKMFC